MADEQGRHDHQFMFFQELHGLPGLLYGQAFPDVLEHVVPMILEPHHKLIDARLAETVQQVLVPDDQVGPRLEPEALIRLSLEHLLDETDALLPVDVEGIVAHIEDVAVVFFFEKLELIGDPFWGSDSSMSSYRRPIPSRRCNPRCILLKN